MQGTNRNANRSEAELSETKNEKRNMKYVSPLTSYILSLTFFILLSSFLLFSPSSLVSQTWRDASEPVEERITDLLSRMTVEEKCSQMLYNCPSIERLGIPAYNWWSEALHGVARMGRATVFPQPIGMAATFDTALIYQNK